MLSILASCALAGLCIAAPHPRAAGSTFSVTSGTKVALQDAAPVGVSFEFFAWPQYATAVPPQQQCLQNLQDAAGSPTRVRIGGTTQDRATYDPALSTAVKYSVATAADAPLNLTFGPSYFNTAAQLAGPTIIGLNRQLNKLNLTIAAATVAVSKMSNLFAFELGNEPNLYAASSPITQGKSWTPSADAQSQTVWQAALNASIPSLHTAHPNGSVQAGVWIDTSFKWAPSELIPVEQQQGTLGLVASFSEHNYPQSACGGSTTNLSQLMNHTAVIQNVRQFQGQVAAANKVGKQVVFGETNSATCGGGGISPTFGAGIWVADYSFQAVLQGIARLYFHQGTVDYSPYSWWGTNYVYAPYYGAYFVSAALGGSAAVAQLDDGGSDLAVYAMYTHGSDASPAKLAIINTAYYPNTTASAGTSTRPQSTVRLTGLRSGSAATLRRLAAPYATSQQELGQVPTWAGRSFSNAKCAFAGTEKTEAVAVGADGTTSVVVAASEAVLLYL